jgi:arylsulfatase
VTLFPSRTRRKTSTRVGKPIAWQTAKPGDAYPSGSAPRIAGKAFHVDVIVEPRGSDGVLIAHGGSAVGYSLYIKNQKLTWAVRYGTNSIQRLTTNLPDKPNSRLRASVSPNGLELRVNERKPVVVKRFGVLGRHPQEGLCIGHDNANPVDNQSTRKRFGGKLSGLKVTVGDRLKTSKPDN